MNSPGVTTIKLLRFGDCGRERPASVAISGYMTLMPGDIISTGTPAGVGCGQKPPTYLKAGDVVELAIVGLGRQRQRAVGERVTAAGVG